MAVLGGQEGEVDGLEGKVAIVTGGGSGLGKEVCRSLAEAGVSVVCGDVSLDLASQTADEMSGTGARILPVKLDVRSEASAAQVCESVAEDLGALDILVNNAGVDHTLPIEDLTTEEWDHVISVNLRGPFLMAKHALRTMRPRGAGHIVNIASTASKRAWPNAGAYHASKWGLIGFSHSLHSEARRYGVKVTAVVVGGMKTPFILERFPDVDADTLQDPANVARVVRFVLTQPEETVVPEVMVVPMKETSWP